jgi:FAD:protein FMN transferase
MGHSAVYIFPTLLIAALTGACRNNHPPAEIVLRGLTMGTTYTIRIVDRHPAGNLHLDRSRIQDGVNEVLEEVNQRMSAFRADSEISSFNRRSDTAWFSVSTDTAAVVAHAIEISRLSDGAFDVTVAPLIDLWGFGPVHPSRLPPNDADVTIVKKRCGWEKLAVRCQPPALRKLSPFITCNLSAIAKGFGVDQVAARLREFGYQDYLVEIGGEVAGHGQNSQGRFWNIGIECPDPESHQLETSLRLHDAAMATSGDYHNYFEKNGVHYSHTIDPQTGRPITHALASVTVVATTCMHADALATAINVLGPEKGFDLAERANVAVLLVIHKGKKNFLERRNRAFDRLLAG